MPHGLSFDQVLKEVFLLWLFVLSALLLLGARKPRPMIHIGQHPALIRSATKIDLLLGQHQVFLVIMLHASSEVHRLWAAISCIECHVR